jgi:SSS family transporter
MYAVVVASLGVWAGRQERDTDDFFLAGRSMGWMPVAASSLATALSALTFIGVPGAAYGGAFLYLQFGLGNFLGYYLLSRWFLPRYYELRVTTVYELLGHRFGLMSRTAASIFFIFSRILGSGVRLAGCAIAVSVFFGLGLETAIVLIASFALLYTATGGIKAIIWTDMLQLGLFVVGALATLAVIWSALPGGFSEFLTVGAAAGKFETFKFDFNLTDGTTFWAGNVFSLVIGLAVGACDQDLAQRMLTCRNVGEAKKAAWAAGIAPLFTTLLFLTVGASLWVYYQRFPDPGIDALIAQTPPRNDWVFPHFIVNVLPAGLRGLLVAGLLAAAMSSLDSALNGLASTAFIDVYKPYWGKDRELTQAEALRFSRVLVAVFAVVLAITAMIFGQQPSILWFGLQAMGWTYGGLLGLFLLAIFTERQVSEFGNIVAMVSSVAVVLFFTNDLFPALSAMRRWVLSPLGIDAIGWAWGIVIGTAWTYAVAALWPTGAGMRAVK